MIRRLPFPTPAENTSHEFVDLGFDFIGVEEMSATSQSPANLPLFFITLPRTPKSHKIFKITRPCHIVVRVQACKAQTGLTHCYNCHKFDHVRANCKQSPRCMWCGGGHLKKECPENGNTALIPTFWNCKLIDGEEPHPSNYRGCRHATEEMRKRKLQRVPKATKGRVFSSSHTTPGLSFAAALRSNTQQEQQPRPPSVAQACLATGGEMRHSQQVPSQFRLLMQTVRERDVQSSRNGISASHDRAQWGRARTGIVLKLMKQNSRYNSWAGDTTALARASSNFKRQTRPHVREGAPHEQTRNCLTVIKKLVLGPRWVLDTMTNWATDRRS
jgi:hypothetical protein